MREGPLLRTLTEGRIEMKTARESLSMMLLDWMMKEVQQVEGES